LNFALDYYIVYHLHCTLESGHTLLRKTFNFYKKYKSKKQAKEMHKLEQPDTETNIQRQTDTHRQTNTYPETSERINQVLNGRLR